ncbi:MAG: hypothetical protein KAJ10_14285 [Thermodesulfovibrionia bacterium]|nr:hypothetical protein [Thermodesulfovibrionia bacterium]
MRLSITGSFSLEGLWTEPSDEPLKTSISYQLLTYAQLIKYRNRMLLAGDIVSNIRSINNCIYNNVQVAVLDKKDDIINFLEMIETGLYDKLIEEMLKDSMLSREETRKLEFIVFYLHWKADVTSRKTSYDCDACRRWDFIKTRYCYLENNVLDLPNLRVVTDEVTGERVLDKNEDSKEITETELLEMLNELSEVNKDLSTFEIFMKYFFGMMDEGKRVELCPEAIKIHSENLAEMFEMEARCHEYNIFPFAGGQFDQTALLVEAFDAIRSGRNAFASKKSEELAATGAKGAK